MAFKALRNTVTNSINGIKGSITNSAISKTLNQVQGLVSGAGDGFSGAQGKVAAQLLKKSTYVLYSTISIRPRYK